MNRQYYGKPRKGICDKPSSDARPLGINNKFYGGSPLPMPRGYYLGVTGVLSRVSYFAHHLDEKSSTRTSVLFIKSAFLNVFSFESTVANFLVTLNLLLL